MEMRFMGILPESLISALSSDLQNAVGYSYEDLIALPAIPPDSSHRMASAVSLAHSFGKKFLPTNTEGPDAACFAKFLSSNSDAGAWELRLNTSLDEELWGLFKQEVYRFFYPGGYNLIDSLDTIFLNGKVGPGASVGALNGDFYTKFFASKLTCTSKGLVKHYKSMINRIPEWFSAELVRASAHSVPVITQGSRLSFVPKNVTISRSICTEPGLNMFYQLGLGNMLVERLRRYFHIDVRLQPDINAGLARQGSLDGSWSTIDLESASDSVSMKLCQEVIPRDVLTYFTLLRSPTTSFKGDMLKLQMISSMGNGYTFPLQTMLFAAMVRAVYTSLAIREQAHVFGDDIAILSCAYPRVVRLLTLAGFKVNHSKSFSEGPFRESCGHDYHSGRDVRGVYIKSLATLQDKYSAINALNWFSAKTGLMVPLTVEWLLRHVDQSFEIPLWEDPSGGIKMPLSMVKTRRKSETTFGTIYSIYRFKARRARIDDRGWIAPIRGRKIIYNPSGLLVAFVSGVALSSGLPLREEGKWRKKRLSCSFWDSLGSSLIQKDEFDIRRLETAICYNTGRY
jgi:hypothetical protein